MNVSIVCIIYGRNMHFPGPLLWCCVHHIASLIKVANTRAMKPPMVHVVLCYHLQGLRPSGSQSVSLSVSQSVRQWHKTTLHGGTKLPGKILPQFLTLMEMVPIWMCKKIIPLWFVDTLWQSFAVYSPNNYYTEYLKTRVLKI